MKLDAIENIRHLFGKNITVSRISDIAKYIGVGDFTHVAKFQYKDIVFYRASIRRFNWAKYFDIEREAAIAVDKKLIEKGEEPVNILKKKCS
jgi:hypothetical protein